MEDSQLKDYQGDYEEYLRKNSAEAQIMSDKAAKARELQKSQIKSKSKVSQPPSWHSPAACIDQPQAHALLAAFLAACHQ